MAVFSGLDHVKIPNVKDSVYPVQLILGSLVGKLYGRIILRYVCM